MPHRHRHLPKRRGRRQPPTLTGLRVAALLCLCLGLAARRPTPADAQAQLVLKIATTAAARSPLADHLRDVAADVAQRSHGTTHPKVFTDGVLGNDTTLIARTIEGSIQMYAGDLQSLAETIPEVAVLGAPFVLGDASHADRALDRGVKRRLEPLLERRGLVFGNWAGNAERVWISPRPLRGVADFDQARLRVAGAHADLWLTALGAQPAGPFPLEASPAPEVRPIVDSTPLQAAAAGHDRFATHVLRAGHGRTVSVLVFSKRWFDGLPAQAQRDLRAQQRELTAAARQHLRAQNARVLSAWETRGVEVQVMDGGELRGLKRALRTVPSEIAKRAGGAAFPLWKAAR